MASRTNGIDHSVARIGPFGPCTAANVIVVTGSAFSTNCKRPQKRLKLKFAVARRMAAAAMDARTLANRMAQHKLLLFCKNNTEKCVRPLHKHANGRYRLIPCSSILIGTVQPLNCVLCFTFFLSLSLYSLCLACCCASFGMHFLFRRSTHTHFALDCYYSFCLAHSAHSNRARSSPNTVRTSAFVLSFPIDRRPIDRSHQFSEQKTIFFRVLLSAVRACSRFLPCDLCAIPRIYLPSCFRR